jgi:hypothetical protein
MRKNQKSSLPIEALGGLTAVLSTLTILGHRPTAQALASATT